MRLLWCGTCSIKPYLAALKRRRKAPIGTALGSLGLIGLLSKFWQAKIYTSLRGWHQQLCIYCQAYVGEHVRNFRFGIFLPFFSFLPFYLVHPHVCIWYAFRELWFMSYCLGIDMDTALFRNYIELIGQFWKSKENAPFSKLHVQSKFNGIEKN